MVKINKIIAAVSIIIVSILAVIIGMFNSMNNVIILGTILYGVGAGLMIWALYGKYQQDEKPVVTPIVEPIIEKVTEINNEQHNETTDKKDI